jgi:hypothetical protein
MPKYEVYKTITYDYSQWVEAETPEKALDVVNHGEWDNMEQTDEFFTVFDEAGSYELRQPQVSPA